LGQKYIPRKRLGGYRTSGECPGGVRGARRSPGPRGHGPRGPPV